MHGAVSYYYYYYYYCLPARRYATLGRGQPHHAAESCGYPDGARLARARVRVRARG